MFISGITDLWLKLANVTTDIYIYVCIYIEILVTMMNDLIGMKMIDLMGT